MHLTLGLHPQEVWTAPLQKIPGKRLYASLDNRDDDDDDADDNGGRSSSDGIENLDRYHRQNLAHFTKNNM